MPMISTDFHQDTSNWLEGFDGLQIWCIDCRDNSVNQSIQSISIICYVSLKTEKGDPHAAPCQLWCFARRIFLRGQRIPGRLQQCNTFGISPLEMDRDRSTANVVWKCWAAALLLSYRGYLMLAQMILNVSKSDMFLVWRFEALVPLGTG